MADSDDCGSVNEHEDWINVDADGSDGTGPAVAAVLRSVAQTLDEAPEDARYNFALEVEEQ